MEKRIRRILEKNTAFFAISKDVPHRLHHYSIGFDAEGWGGGGGYVERLRGKIGGGERK
jgi:hypothetical protein